MKKDSIRGWRDVFRFTLIQMVKSKAYLVTMAIMVIMAMVSMPIMNLVMADGIADGSEQSAIEKLYLYNMTPYRKLDLQSELSKAYEHIVIEETNESMEQLQERILGEETNAIALILMEDEQYCYIQFLRSPDGDVTTYELSLLGESVQNAYTKAKVQTLGLTKEEMTFFEISVIASSSIVDTEDAIVLEDTSISDVEYWFVYGMMFAVLMVCVMGSSQVAGSIVQEKSSRIVEYLLTSIRPLALIVGKVLAMLTAVLAQMIVLILSAFISSKIGETISGTGTNIITQYMTPEMLSSLNFGNIVLGLIVAGFGMILYATLAGLCGATASRMEDASESQMLLTFTSLIGFYIGMGASTTLMTSGDNAFVTFALIFPISSAFLLPAALLIGKANVITAVIAIIVLLISIVLMFQFVAKVYEALILHNGSRIKMKEVIAMARQTKKKGEKKNE